MFYPDPSMPGTSSTTDYEEMTYDANGNRTGGRLRDATSVSITYDNLNRMTVDLEGGTYDYDNLGRVTSTTKFSRTSAFAYDAFDNILSETTGLGAVSYQYDLAGRRTRLTWPDSVYVTYDWDDASNLTAIKLSGSTTLAAFGYDSLGRRTSLTRGNGTSSSYSYDDRSALTGFGLDLASTGNDQTVALTRDAFGRITVKAGTNNTYDMAPPGAWTGGTDYNPNGLNQIATAGGLTFSYDGRGNTTSNGSDSFTYDTGNRMTGMNSGTVALAYDAPGRLYEHTASGTTTRYQYDKSDLITEYIGGTVQRRYVHGPKTDEPLVWFEGSGTGTPHYLMADERGSIVAVTDGSGAAEAINTYDEYGAPATTSATYASRFRYTGQVWFGDLDLYYFKARMYDPGTGRFVQADPIGYGDGLNMYAYAGNDPVNGSDPSGTAWCNSAGTWCDDFSPPPNEPGIEIECNRPRSAGYNYDIPAGPDEGITGVAGRRPLDCNILVGPVPDLARDALNGGGPTGISGGGARGGGSPGIFLSGFAVVFSGSNGKKAPTSTCPLIDVAASNKNIYTHALNIFSDAMGGLEHADSAMKVLNKYMETTTGVKVIAAGGSAADMLSPALMVMGSVAAVTGMTHSGIPLRQAIGAELVTQGASYGSGLVGSLAGPVGTIGAQMAYGAFAEEKVRMGTLRAINNC